MTATTEIADSNLADRSGKDGPACRAGPHLAVEPIAAATASGLAFRAVVADELYGEYPASGRGTPRGGDRSASPTK